jgi:hypothetical protein
MANLTVTEKEHWRSRIGARIDRKIETIKAGDPGLFDRINEQAKLRAIESLGLTEARAELDRIAIQEKQLQTVEKHAIRAMVARIRGTTLEDLDHHIYEGQMRSEIDSAISRRQAVHNDDLLAETEIGRAVLRLRAEKDTLIDAIWLAISPKQIRDLRTRVGTLLGTEATELEREALAIEPTADA